MRSNLLCFHGLEGVGDDGGFRSGYYKHPTKGGKEDKCEEVK